MHVHACGCVFVHVCVAAERCACVCVRVPASMAPRWALLALGCALVLLPRCAAGPTQPTYPGDEAPLEELLRFYSDLQQYLNVVTRHR
uniref:Pancreatic hormone n=1 Tax=Strix occidentalis caurina TaxID=311401 RepID=A0A8D0EY02_STROC